VIRRALAASLLVLGCGVAAWAMPDGFKNLHHFPKDISEDALKDEMHLIKRSLGTKCEHCHVIKPTRDFSVDTDAKKTARSMLDMTDELNKKLMTTDFLGMKKVPKATCYMCHKGHEKVEVAPKDEADEKRFNDMKNSGRKKRTIDAMKKLTDALNKDFFTWKDAPKASCWMCHRGRGEFKVNAPKEDPRDGDDDESAEGKKDDGKKDAVPSDPKKRDGGERGKREKDDDDDDDD
jgi:hypothetical protein